MHIDENIQIKVKDANVWYSGREDKHVLKDITMDIPKNRITAIIGPSGCGKSTYIRLFNRMNDLIPACRFAGSISIDGQDINDPAMDVVSLRRRVGMVFQKPNPFPKSIFKNISYGLEVNGMRDKQLIKERVIQSLKQAALYDEISERLNDSAFALSGGQQQRLCIARCLAVAPEVILFDEPCASLDPISTSKIEELMLELKKYYTIIIVTHNLQQASRISDYTAFLLLGDLVEYGPTGRVFTVPEDKRTEEYLTGKFG